MTITQDRETVARAHDSLARTYISIGRLFLEIPTAELLSSAKCDLACIREDIHRVSPELEVCTDRLCEAMSESLANIRTDYARLFAGVKKLPAPPWESCYLSGKRQVCTKITEDVRQAYLEACMCQEPSEVEPDDHIGLELQFLGVLSKRIASAVESEDADLLAATSSQRTDFITEHLSRWAEAFSTDLERAAGTEFYRSLAQLTAGLIRYETESSIRCLE